MRIAALIYFGFMSLMQGLQMARYLGLVRSTIGVVGTPTLAFVAFKSVLFNGLSFVAVICVSGWRALTYIALAHLVMKLIDTAACFSVTCGYSASAALGAKGMRSLKIGKIAEVCADCVLCVVFWRAFGL